MSLSTYYLEYGRHLARLHRRRRRRRRRAYAPTSNTASHDNHEKINLVSYMGMGLRLAALWAAGAPLISNSSKKTCQSTNPRVNVVPRSTMNTNGETEN